MYIYIYMYRCVYIHYSFASQLIHSLIVSTVLTPGSRPTYSREVLRHPRPEGPTSKIRANWFSGNVYSSTIG